VHQILRDVVGEALGEARGWIDRWGPPLWVRVRDEQFRTVARCVPGVVYLVRHGPERTPLFMSVAVEVLDAAFRVAGTGSLGCWRAAALVRIGEPAADLAVLLAIVSSLQNRALPAKLVVFGEVGLAGEIRPAPRGQERLREAAKLGFTRALIPEANQSRQAIGGLEVIAVRRVEEAVGRLRELA